MKKGVKASRERTEIGAREREIGGESRKSKVSRIGRKKKIRERRGAEKKGTENKEVKRRRKRSVLEGRTDPFGPHHRTLPRRVLDDRGEL